MASDIIRSLQNQFGHVPLNIASAWYWSILTPFCITNCSEIINQNFSLMSSMYQQLFGLKIVVYLKLGHKFDQQFQKMTALKASRTMLHLKFQNVNAVNHCLHSWISYRTSFCRNVNVITARNKTLENYWTLVIIKDAAHCFPNIKEHSFRLQ